MTSRYTLRMHEITRLLRLDLPSIDEKEALLVGSLQRLLVRDGWTDLSYWPGGVRAKRTVRHCTFGALHLKHLKAPERRARARVAVLRLLEERANDQFGDELCLVTDAAPDHDSEALISSAGIDWWQLESATSRTTRIEVGPKVDGRKAKGPRAPWVVDGKVRGADARARRGAIGSGAGWVRVRLRLSGSGEVVLPATTTVIARKRGYQNGVLLLPTRAHVGRELLVDFFCLNRDAALSDATVLYDLGPLVGDPRLLELATVLENRLVSHRDSRDLVQDAVWEVFSSDRLSNETMDRLRALPFRPSI